ncbi:hypothetical protein ACRAWF_23850, partial [Streptomyces sp. L7]
MEREEASREVHILRGCRGHRVPRPVVAEKRWRRPDPPHRPPLRDIIWRPLHGCAAELEATCSAGCGLRATVSTRRGPHGRLRRRPRRPRPRLARRAGAV